MSRHSELRSFQIPKHRLWIPRLLSEFYCLLFGTACMIKSLKESWSHVFGPLPAGDMARSAGRTIMQTSIQVKNPSTLEQNPVTLGSRERPLGAFQGADRCQSRCQREGRGRQHRLDFGSQERLRGGCQGADQCQC